MVQRTASERDWRRRAWVAAAVLAVSSACGGETVAAGDGRSPEIRVGHVLVGQGLVADAAAIRCLGDADGWTGREELEPRAAVDPTDPEHIVAAWMARVRGERGAIVAAVSRTGGRTWEPPRVLPFSECAGGPAGLRATSDPWVSFGPEGRVYVSAIGWTPGEDLDSASVVGVVASGDGGRSWDALARVSESRTPEFMHDNTAIAADPFEPGTVWVATTYWGPVGRPVAVSRTADGGRTWSPLGFATVAEWGTPAHGAPQPVLTESRDYLFFGDGPAGSRPSFVRRERSPTSELDRGAPDAGGPSGPRAVDAGWSAPVAIHEGAPIEGAIRFPGTDDEIQIAEDIVDAASDPETGRLWVVFTSAADDDPSRPTVRISVSADGGTSWAAAIPVGDPGEATWRPTLAVGPGGPAVVTYFRAAPDAATASGAAGAPDAFDTEVRLRTFEASPGGLEPGTAATLDRFPWRARANGSRFLGDYHGLVVSGSAAVAVYSRSTPDGARVVAVRTPLP